MAKEQMPATGNLYSRLGVRRSATDEQVRTAYYRLAKIFHPDRRKGSERDSETFNSIVRAAAILRNPARRKLYDLGAIDEDGALGRSSRRWPHWSYRERVLACLAAALTVLISGVAFYSLDKSGGAFPPVDAHAGHKEKSPAAGAVSHGGSLARTAAEGKEPALAPRIDDSPARPIEALQRQEAAYSPPPAIAGNQARNQAAQKSSIFLEKPAAAGRNGRIHPGSGSMILSSLPRKIPRMRSECALTSAARDILAGIMSR
jgi:curved DNA-binding protein CbpA